MKFSARSVIKPNLVTARSNALVCGLLFAGIAGSKPAREMDIVCYECCVLTGTESLQLADPSSRGFLLSLFVVKHNKTKQKPCAPTRSRYKEVRRRNKKDSLVSVI